MNRESRRVYEILVNHPAGLHFDGLAELARLERADMEAALADLRALGLLETRPGDSLALGAVAPDSARSRVLGPILRALDEKQSQVDGLWRIYADLRCVYNGGALHHSMVDSLEVLHELDAVRAVAAELTTGAEREVLVSQPGGAGANGAPGEPVVPVDAALTRGLRVRALYQHTARYSPAVVNFVETVSVLGAEVRTSGDGFMQLVLFDNDVALIGLRNDPHGAVIVHNPHVVHFMSSAFERVWAEAKGFTSTYDHDELRYVSDSIETAIIRFLVDGVEDKIIARRLGMSLRTLQRHVSQVMKRIGAKNRLHAGYLIRQYGLLE